MKKVKKQTAYARFTKFDWYGFAGCEPFESGGEPFIMDCGFGLIIADSNGMMVTVAPDFNEEYTRNYVSKNFEQEAELTLAAIAAHGHLAPETLLAFGFVTFTEAVR